MNRKEFLSFKFQKYIHNASIENPFNFPSSFDFSIHLIFIKIQKYKTIVFEKISFSVLIKNAFE